MINREKEEFAPEYRYERKFQIKELSKNQIEHFIKINPAKFFAVYSPRYVNNIYIDTIDKQHYRDSILGSDKRQKIRIRWYGDLFGNIQNPVLEFKIKNGLVGIKRSYPLKSFILDTHFNAQVINELIKNSEVPLHLQIQLKNYEAPILNRYYRQYYLSGDEQIRVTLDSNIEFFKLNHQTNHFLNQFKLMNNFILEMKYPIAAEAYVNSISQEFPFRMNKISKYTFGIEQLYNF